jgi:hypothetical protein
MAGKQTSGDNSERRKNAKTARDAGKRPSEVGATFGADKQLTSAPRPMTHQERIDLKKEGRREGTGQRLPKARPGSRDRETEDRERFPRS